jgi:homoserine dehydrogenase
VALGREDPLVGIDGTLNALICRADPVGEVTVVGPGAGPELAGQGVLSDLIALMRGCSRAICKGAPRR